MIIDFSIKNGFTLVLLLCLLSCGESKNSKVEISAIAPIDSLEIELPEEYLEYTSWTTYQRQGQQILVEYGKGSNESLVIHQVDFLTAHYLEPIIIPKEGPNGYNSSGADVFFKNQDSIFVFPAAKPHFYLYDGSGQQIEKFSFNAPDNFNHYVSGYYSSAVFLNEKMFIPTSQFLRIEDPEFLTKSTPVRSYDFNSNQLVDSIPYPEYTKGKAITIDRLTPSLAVINQDSLVINYGFSDSLYFWNPASKTISSMYLSADQFGEGRLFETFPDQGEGLAFKIKEVDYETTIYHNNRLYRMISYVPKEDRSLQAYEILQNQLRQLVLLEFDLETKEKRIYAMPIAKYFTFIDDHLYVGGVSIREEGDKTLRKFYQYQLE